MIGNYKSRISVVFFALLFAYLLILINLWYIQIWNTSFFKNLGSQQYHVTITQTPPRAPIYDRTGNHLLALNKDCVSAFVIPHKIQQPEKLLHFLNAHFPSAVGRLAQNKKKYFMYVKRRLAEDEQKLIEQENLADVYLLQETTRSYPSNAARTIVGLTDIDNNGLFGIELACDRQLKGTPSTHSLEKDARSGFYYFKKETKVKGKTGSPVQLTIDSDLQFLVDQELQAAITKYSAQEGAIIVMLPNNGEILALASYPQFDATASSFHQDHTKCRPITQSYECGSVFKVFTALAALQEGVVTPDEVIDCKNTKTAYIDGRQINTVRPHGAIPFSEVIAQSNNIGIAQVAKRLDTKLYDHLTKLGFGSKTGIELPGEAKGFVNHPANWSKQSIISLSYGYESTATLLQLACAFCTIANDGKRVIPTIIKNDVVKNKDNKQLYDAQRVRELKEILAHTTLHGTARRAAIKGYHIMCKTGTANIVKNGIYLKDKSMFTCTGILEKNNFQAVIVTCIRNTKQKNLYAAGVAAPLLERVAEKVILHERII